MSEPISNTPLREVFLDKVAAFEKTHPEEGKRLGGDLLYWGSSVDTNQGTLWNLIESQIGYRVNIHLSEGHKISPEEFIDYLFAPNPDGVITADIIMGKLQVG